MTGLLVGGMPAAGGGKAQARVNLTSLRASLVANARLRVLWVAMIFACVAAAAVLRIGFLGLSDQATRTTSLAEALLPPRGELTDRNGVPLARAFPAYALWFNPDALGDPANPLIKSPRAVATGLKRIFPAISVEDTIDKLAAGRPVYLQRRILPEDANRVMALGELALELPRETDRHYPQGSMGAHVLGYVDREGKGRIGMEQVLNDRLMDPARRGTSVALSIDMRAQGALEDELGRGMLATNAVGAAGIVLDVDTGEIMALASLPEFDPNRVEVAGSAAIGRDAEERRGSQKLQPCDQSGLRTGFDLQTADHCRGNRCRNRPGFRAPLRCVASEIGPFQHQGQPFHRQPSQRGRNADPFIQHHYGADCR